MWIDEAANRMGVRKATLYKWRQAGKGPTSFQVARRIVSRIADLDAYIECQYQAAIKPDPQHEYDARPPEPRHPRRGPRRPS
ncbi:helix-turn-helix transcriptional regulator [Streptomyces hyaluromycini]|uniref:helix-turn-helix transcriptional regulator n=1 Tax=Streptomyces hyaluromycini TaxID=1377993 RepID=UPI00142DB413